MNELTKRALTGAVFVAVLVSCIWLNPWAQWSLFLLISMVSIYEFCKITHHTRNMVVMWVVAAILYAAFSGIGLAGYGAVLLSLAAGTILITSLFGKEMDIQTGANRALALVYLVIPFALLNVFNSDFEVNRVLVLGLFIMVWANDTGAYLIGRVIGKNKLFERISPKKTIEGFAGGVAMAALVGFILSQFFEVLPPWLWIVLGVVTGVFSTLGDLVESMIKRIGGVKDSGNFMPGHGGALDRFDGAIMAIPVVYVIVQLLAFGGLG